MKGPMKDYPKQFGLKCDTMDFSVFTDTVKADVNLPHFGSFLTSAQIKSDDVCVEVVFKILPVYFEKVFIATKNIGQGFKLFFFQ